MHIYRCKGSSMDDSFQQYWKATTKDLPDYLTVKWEKLIGTKYRECQRYYHTLKHIVEMKALRDTFIGKLQKPILVDYAIIFHE